MSKKVKKTTKKPLLKATTETIKKTKIRVIGVGGGGGTIVSEIATRIPKASFVAANTDLQALRSCSRKVSRFQFGQGLTHGLGTGMSTDIGKEAALQEKERIKKLLEGQDLCILVACLGGGTGSGALPVFAKISRDLGNLTYGIFTLPFNFEGEKKMEIARESLRKVKNYLNVLSIIPNERVFQTISKETPLRQALSVVNKSLAESLEGLIEIIYEPGLINIDFADFKTIMEGRGKLAYLNTELIQRKGSSVKDLTTRVLSSSLYPYTIKGAKGVLFNIAGEKELSLSEVSQISKTIADLVNPEAKIIFGISQGSKYSGIIKTTLLATGCGMKIFPSEAKKKSGKKPKKKMVKEEEEKKKTESRKKTRVKRKKKVSPKRKKKVKIEEKKEKVGESKPEPPKEEKIRKNGLQLKREAEEVEKEMLEQEKAWERPPFLKSDEAKTSSSPSSRMTRLGGR